jgi:acyl-CoA synthetase (NDP forming)
MSSAPAGGTCLGEARATLDRLFSPRAVAVVGSATPGKIGYQLVKQIVDGGFEHVYAVNPKSQGACGASGCATIAAIGEPVDLVVVAAPAAVVPGVLEECGAAGVHAVVVITSGFSEVGNQAGEAEIKRIARRHGIRMVGPNCAGIVNTHHRLFASLETRPPAGAVSFISQSGAVGGAVLSWAEEQGLGFAKFLSYGNRADLDEIDLLPYLAEDPETRAGALYIESVSDGRRFLDAVRAFTRVKPLVVIKCGRSQAGQRAALSHTGSLAGADAVYDAALRSCGAIRVETIEEMFDLCKGFVSLPPVRGRRIAIVTNSGGPGVLAADRAEAAGLAMPEPSPALRSKLAERLPPYCSPGNPIDLTVEATETSYRETLCAVLEEYDAALAIDVSTPYLDSLALARGVCAAAQQTSKPVAANFMAGRDVAEAVAYVEQQGLPNFATGERAVTVLARMSEYAARSVVAPRPDVPCEQLSLPGKGPLLEPEAMGWLGENGLPVPEFRFAAGVEEVVQACNAVGYPVVMKVVSPDILHKSEWGGVKLDLRDDQAARAAFKAIHAGARDKDFRGVVVYPQVKGAQEVLLGLSHDPQFGPIVVFGMGGIYTEVWRDIALRVAPLEYAEAAAMIREVRAFPILEGVRGQTRCDLEALAATLVTLSLLPFRYPEIAAVDLNPVFVWPEGLVVGDARVIRKGREKQ